MTDPGLDNVVPKKKRSVLLSGLGFYKLSAQRRKQLTYVFVGSLIVHIVGLIGFGGYIIMRDKPEEVTTFQTPPPSRTYQPRKLEHRVKLQKRQRSSSRPSVVPRLAAMKMSQVALPDIKMNPKVIHTTFQPKFKAVSGKGMGAGLGAGYGTHGFGEGISSVDFFGIRASGEKIVILVDVSLSMVEEDRGGIAGFMAVKRRVGQVVDALSDAALFNVMVFADGASAMSPKLVIADNENKTRAKLYIRPFNTEGNWGHDQGNLHPSNEGLASAGGTTRLDIPLSAAFEMGADTVLIISDGIPRVQKAQSADQVRAYQQRAAAWQQQHAAELAAWDSQWGGSAGVAERVWVPATKAASKAAPKGPPKEGEAPRSTGGRAGHWQVVHPRGWHARPKAPPMPKPGFWTLADFVGHLDKLYEHYYKPKGQKKPVVHCIGYQIDKEGGAFLRSLAREYHGQYRRVARVR